MRISENAQYSARCLAGGKRPVTSVDGGGEKVYYDVHVVFDGQGRPAVQ